MSENMIVELRGLLSQPFTKECWQEIVELIQKLPDGEESEFVFSYFWKHLQGKQTSLHQTEVPSQNKLTGLWKCTYVKRESGSLDTSTEIEYDTIDGVREYESELNESDTWSQANELHYYLEIHADGTYRELDLTQQPATGKCEMIHGMPIQYGEAEDIEEKLAELRNESPGLVAEIAGYEHTYKTDEQGYAICFEANKLKTNTELLLLSEDSDQWCEDKVSLTSEQSLHRRGYVLWDGVYFNIREIDYELIARFE